MCPCAACVYGAWAGRESCSWVTRGGRQRHVAGCGPSKPRAYGRFSIFSLRPDAHHQHPERLERRRTKRASKEEQQRIKRTTPVSGTSPETGGPFGAANIARSINPTVSSHQLVPLVPDLGQRGTWICVKRFPADDFGSPGQGGVDTAFTAAGSRSSRRRSRDVCGGGQGVIGSHRDVRSRAPGGSCLARRLTA